MIYQSKKDEEVYAKLVSQDDKFKTSILEFITGEKTGKTISVSDATLKRWWRKSEKQEDTAEVFAVDVENEDGSISHVELGTDTFIPDVDDNAVDPDEFNPPEDKKHYMEMPPLVKKLYKLGEDPFPDIDTVVDMLVSWGADVKSVSSFIKLIDGTKILFRRNIRVISKSCLEVRMNEETASKVTSFEVQNVPLKGALLYNLPYVVYAKNISDLEKVIKEII